MTPSQEFVEQHTKRELDASQPQVKKYPQRIAMYTLTDEPGYGPRTAYNGYSGYSGDV
jgi:hypothetical protein